MIFVLWLIPAMIWNYHVKAAMSNTILYQIPEQVWITYTDTQWNNFPMWSITLYSWNYSYEILDRDLWANELSWYWYYFQWWNNYWFSTPISNTTSNQVDASNYWPNTVNGYYVNNVFYDKKNKNWDRSNNWNLWWDTTNTNEARQWPCPTWYHVPSSWEIQTLYDVFLSLSWKQEYCDTANDVDCFSDVLYIAKAWEILPNNQQNVQWTVAHWYSSTPVSASMYAYSMQIDGTTFSIDRKESRAYWKNIRCFSNDFGVYKEDIQIYTVEFETDWWTEIDSQIVTWNEYVLQPDAPIKTWYEFAWWYKTWMEELWKFDTDVVTWDMTLYAKWEEIPVYTVEFETDWWTEIDSQIVTWNEYVLQPDAPIKTWYEFAWWYKTWMEELWKFDTDVVTWDMILYAQWNKPRCQNQWTQYSWVIWNCEEGTITVTNGLQSITMQDMNVWATEVSYWVNASTWSYWLYYQWWGMTGYDYSLSSWQAISQWFIQDNDVWSNITSWWTTDQEKQICGEWYHIPTNSEWQEVINMYTSNGNDLVSFGVSLKIPFAWSRNNNAVMEEFGNRAALWSSSSYGTNKATFIYLNPSPVLKRNERAQAISIRCFKDVDTPIIDEPWIKVTFIANPADFIGWKFADWTTEKTINYQLMTWWYYQWPEEIQIPNLSWNYTFEWWYTNILLTPESRWTWLNASTTYTAITLYAKYLPFEEKTQTWDWVTFTIMDRNLWATDYVSGYSYGIDNNPVSVRWNYYQWWNNFWFPTEWSYPNTLWLVLVKNYSDNQRWPGNYYFNGTFIKQSDRWDEEDNRNLWWWTWETQNIVNSDADKQWPCPAWYHVPSTYEWLASRNLFQKWQATEDWMEYCNFIHTTNKWIQYCMLAALGMPFAGYRNGSSSSTIDWGFSAHYWSSTAHSTKYAYRLDTNSSRLDPQYWDYRARAFPLRCFKNSDFLTLTFDSNWWSEVESQTWFKRWNPRDTAPTNPTKENVTFDGWYTDKELTQPFSFSNTTYISEDTTLYAKWNKPRCQNQWTQYNWVVWNCEEWTITVTNGTQSITMKDMNVWATEVWYWSSASTWSYWLYYQWWWMTGYTYNMTQAQVIASWFIWDNTWYSATTTWWTRDQQIQICGTWYHIPTSGEMKSIINMFTANWNNAKNFYNAFKIPFPGSRRYDGYKVFYDKIHSYTWSNSFTTSDKAWILSLDASGVSVTNQLRGAAISIRCFQDREIQTYTVTFNSDWWTEIESVEVEENSTFIDPGQPTKTWYEFNGWYISWMETERNFETDIVTGNMTLYVKWIDVTLPTFDFPNNSGYECATWIVRVNNLNDNEELADNPISFDGINWNIVNTFDVFPKKWNDITIITWYVKDLAWNISINTSIFTFVDTWVTATWFTVSRVWTWISVNWKENTNAQEWDCWDFYLTAEISEQWTIWNCTINGDNIIYHANDWVKWIDTCEIKISDFEENSVYVLAKFNDILSTSGLALQAVLSGEVDMTWKSSFVEKSYYYQFNTWDFYIQDEIWSNKWWYTTLSVSNLLWEKNIWNYIDKSNVYLKSNSVFKISWDTNENVKIKTWLDNYISMSNPIIYMYRNENVNDWKIWIYWNNPTLKIIVPALQIPDLYRWKMTVTIYDNE